ncbi:phospho-sugar mutase [Polluticaenibacter yanchengensis]|uniref:Phospho-sugar mutase n=1 Tax=Polluticaenibacter yanchengensis TaxID=3014562 RepID=A0ABT4ULE2_9BACT|nr:phospho-sugar mutase [Chitinophagaceae bacterium LY-5]
MDAAIKAKIDAWLQGDYDQETKNEIKRQLVESPDDLVEGFYKNLEFGTGGLRGIMGIGTNKMNKYTVGMATQGYANYLIKSFGNDIKVAIAHDCRNNSRFFAETVANVMSANGIQVLLFEDLRPTPELSFTIRHFGCKGGVVCTASHNPKEYNGYKAYWDDGAQLVPPHDENVIIEVDKITSVGDVKWQGNPDKITIIGKEVDAEYIKMVKGLSIYPEVIAQQNDLKIVYTSIHGSGIKLVPAVLEAYGFKNVHIVQEQATPDGNFPTVGSPNPEEKSAMQLGLQKAQELDADILLGTDPDADRVGIAIKNNRGEWVLMNGNQTAVLAFNYIIEARKAKGIAQPNDMVIKTIVTTNMIDRFAAANGVACYNVLTGFKHISSLIKAKEGLENYIIGGEESFGLMIGDQIRDKDAVSAVAILCEMAAVEKSKGRTLYQKLVDLYVEYGCFQEHLISITKKGMNGAKEIAEMMERFRNNPPKELAGLAVAKLHDVDINKGTVLATGETYELGLPKSNVLQFILEDGSVISARPSGTEPKIKFYFSVFAPLDRKENYDLVKSQLDTKIETIIKQLQILD